MLDDLPAFLIINKSSEALECGSHAATFVTIETKVGASSSTPRKLMK